MVLSFTILRHQGAQGVCADRRSTRERHDRRMRADKRRCLTRCSASGHASRSIGALRMNQHAPRAPLRGTHPETQSVRGSSGVPRASTRAAGRSIHMSGRISRDGTCLRSHASPTRLANPQLVGPTVRRPGWSSCSGAAIAAGGHFGGLAHGERVGRGELNGEQCDSLLHLGVFSCLCWRYANSLLTNRQQQLDSPYEPGQVQPPRARPAARRDPRRSQPVVRRARLRRGLDRGHRELGRRHPRTRAPLLRWAQGGLCRSARAARRRTRGTTTATGRPQLSCAGGGSRVALAGLDRGQPHDMARHHRARRRHRRPRGQATGRRPRPPPSRCSRRFTPTSPRTLRGCATRSSAGPLSTAPPRDAGYAARPHTNCSPPRSSTSCAPLARHPRHADAHLLSEIRIVEFHASQRRRCQR